MGIRLGPHFQRFNNIFELVSDMYDDYSSFQSPVDILKKMNLTIKPNSSSKSMESCQTLVRIVNKLIQKSSPKEVQRSRSRSNEKKTDERETHGEGLRYHGDTYSPTQ